MTDEEALALTPALREFVQAVNERDPDVIQASFAHTEPATLAVLAAGWVGELLDERDRLRAYLTAANEDAEKSSKAYLDMRKRRDELRDIVHEREARREATASAKQTAASAAERKTA